MEIETRIRAGIASPGNCRTLAMTVLNVSFLPVELTLH
jgi:hypothetical protein